MMLPLSFCAQSEARRFDPVNTCTQVPRGPAPPALTSAAGSIVSVAPEHQLEYAENFEVGIATVLECVIRPTRRDSGGQRRDERCHSGDRETKNG